MRLVTLELALFGHFRGVTLDFSAPGIHVVLGRNEAGKSTTLRAIAGLLYGIEPRSPDARGNAARDLRLGGTLEAGREERFSFVRQGGKTSTLFDAKGNALDDAALHRFIGGVTRESFAHAYGLTHDALKAGAQAILEGKGDLGESLFDAGVGGGGNVQELVKKLAAEADAIFAPKASKPFLNEALKAHTEATKKIKETQMLPEAFAKQEAGLVEETDRRAAALEKKKGLEQRRARLARGSKRAPRERERAHLLEVRAQLGAVTQHVGRIETLQQRFATYERDVDQLRAHRADLHVMSGRIVEAMRVAALAPGTPPESLREHVRSEERVKPLLKQRTMLTERLELAETEIRRSERALERVAVVLPSRTEERIVAVADRDALAGSIERARSLGAIEDRLTTETARVERQRATLASRAQSLFDGTLDALVALRPPSTRAVFTLVERADDLSNRRARSTERTLEIEREVAALEKDAASRAGDFAPPDASALRSARDARDIAWRAVRSAEIAGRAEAELGLDRLLREADVVADRMIAEADRVTALARLRAEISANHAELEKSRVVGLQMQTEQRALDEEARALFANAGIAPRPLSEMADWLTRHAQILEEHGRVVESSAALEDEQTRMARIEADLRTAFARTTAAVAGSRLADLVHAAAARLEAIDDVRRAVAESARVAGEQARTIAEQRQALEERMTMRERDVKALEEVRAKVATLVEPLGLVSNAADEEVNRALAALRDVFDAIDKQSEAEARTKSVEAGIREFDRDLERVAGEVMPDLSGETRVVARELFDRCRRARETSEKIERVDALLAELGDPGPLDEADRAIIAEPDTAESVQQELTDQIDELERESEQGLKQIVGIQLGLERMRKESNAAEAAAQAQHHLARVREGAERWARVKLASVILAREIERYREENQGPLLASASALFARLTLSAYSGIKAGFDDKDRPCLRCVRADGNVEVDVAGLSDGTRDQLYLSLRLASLLRRAEVAEPMPLILDDVLIQLDDHRATAALSVLAEISRKMQVLFFTHHARLVDLARAAIPASELHVHTLAKATADVVVSAP